MYINTHIHNYKGKECGFHFLKCVQIWNKLSVLLFCFRTISKTSRGHCFPWNAKRTCSRLWIISWAPWAKSGLLKSTTWPLAMGPETRELWLWYQHFCKMGHFLYYFLYSPQSKALLLNWLLFRCQDTFVVILQAQEVALQQQIASPQFEENHLLKV